MSLTEREREREIARARERADLARMRFGNAVTGVLDKLRPDRLRHELIEVASDQFELAGRDLLKRFRHWPAALGAAGVAALAIIFWKPARVAAGWAVRLASFAWSTRDLWRRQA